MNPWLVFALGFVAVWLAVFLLKPASRREMLRVSLWTMPFGLTEPLFVPEYWNPPSLFNLAQRTGFDIESLIFCFAVGGIAAVLYEALFPIQHQRMRKHSERTHRFHLLSVFAPVPIFLLLWFLTGINPIYTASIAMLGGGIATVLCRPDLMKKVAVGGLLFLGLYFLFFLLFTLAYPGIVQQVWNLGAISGILLLGVPLEELLFAFTFGTLWAGLYEHLLWYRIGKKGQEG